MELTKLCFILICALGMGQGTTIYNVINSVGEMSNAKCSLDRNCRTKGVYCLNGGTCFKVRKFTCTRNNYRCLCPPNYTGTECGQLIAPCIYDQKWMGDSNCNCLNGGICRKDGDVCSLESYKCECLKGFEGISCQIKTVSENTTSSDGRPPSTVPTNGTSSTAIPADSTSRENNSTNTTTTTIKPTTATVSLTQPANVKNASANTSVDDGPNEQNIVTTETETLRGETTTGATTATRTTHPTTTRMTATSTSSTIEDPTVSKVSIVCPRGLICLNGDCEPDVLDKGVPKCICDLGWVGEHCDIRCEVNCQNGGVCEILDGEPICHCTQGYTGITCESQEASQEPATVLKTDIFKAIKPQQVGRKDFPFSAKKVPDIGSPSTSSGPCDGGCGFGTKCKVNMSSGRLQAECVPVFFRLFRFPPSYPRFARLPADPSKCFSNFVCQHGVCDSKDPRRPSCLCDEGYQGVFCHLKCDKVCLNDGRCIVLGKPRKQYCNCPYQFTGEFCQIVKTYIPIKEIRILSSDQHVEITTEPTTTITAVSPTTKRTIAVRDLRKCAENFVCLNGVCDKSDPNHPKCICEKGFIGSHCTLNCTKSCTNGGKCILIHGDEFCNCPWEYGGEFCERERHVEPGVFIKEA